ncbi:hypothetical protein HYX00_02615 [Candidatus Woesearchaeota archaeon]|nr:hypothetical protein [Candidatus Woesearchaeota archaeon]
MKKKIYVAMPLILKGKERNRIKSAKSKLISTNSKYKNHLFFNPFTEINQNNNGNKLMNECFDIVKESDALLYILPLPLEIDTTFTLGAISEIDLALKHNKPVFVCISGKNIKRFFRINHLNQLLEKLDLKIPSWWLEVRELNISRKFRETY